MDSKAKAGLLAATCVCSIIALILSVVNVKDVLLLPTKYGLVFDAGSTHTSLYIYRWPADKENCLFPDKWEHPQDAKVVGALDLGGASTQITFQPEVPVEDRNTSVFFRLYGTNYSLYSHSYLCYGQSQALKMLLAALHQDTLRAQISHPCYPKGYLETITVAELYNSPCVRAPSSVRPDVVLRVTGTGDPTTCHMVVRSLFDFSCGAPGPCGFNGVYQPPVQGHFFAFAGFYHTFSFLNLTHKQSPSEVNTAVVSFCRRNWEELVRSFPQHLKYLHTYCSMAFYILTLLLDGYKFNKNTWSNIHFSRQAANTDIGWTLGFMLNMTNMIPAEALQHVKVHQPSLWAGAVSFLVLAIVAGLVSVFLHCFWKTK
uniref:ectonucleoside triphosphate diphosphohydrolase 8 n=1 Tax=Lonchura striata TaxID=40157 RepID=UPI000B4CF30F|nr:ectonucleoside triphosphate diphosphohydrolase 8 [Lonchura striata domestica]